MMDNEEFGQDEAPVEPTEVGNSQEPQEQVQESEGGYNPAWEPLKQHLGLQFETIKPELAKIDKSFNDHVTKTNAQYAPWKEFDQQGIRPEQVQQAFGVLQRLNSNPEEVYEALGQFLQENGRLPKNAAEAQEALDNADEDGFGPDNQEIEELRKQVEDLRNFNAARDQQAQAERIQAQAEQQVEAEYRAFEQAHPELSVEDKKEIYQRHYLYAASGPQNIRSLEDVAKEFFSLTERVRSAPRPSDLAPRLPGAGGSVPSAQRKDPSEYSREESQNAIVAALMANN